MIDENFEDLVDESIRRNCLHGTLEFKDNAYFCLICGVDLVRHGFEVYNDKHNPNVKWIGRQKHRNYRRSTNYAGIKPERYYNRPPFARQDFRFLPPFIKIIPKEQRASRIEAFKRKKEIIEKRGNNCEGCNKNLFLYLHHIKPLCMGGSNDDSNLRLLCFDCHKKADYEAFVSASA